MARRYLTSEAKAKEVARWAETIANAERNGYTGDGDRPVEPGHAPREGGYGYVDRGVLDLCARLNALDGVCTLQSCEGHDYFSDAPDTDLVTHRAAELWLWLSEDRARAFYERAHEYGEHPLIEQVALLWGRNREQEIVDVIFDGVSRGRMNESADLIVSWFAPATCGRCGANEFDHIAAICALHATREEQP